MGDADAQLFDGVTIPSLSQISPHTGRHMFQMDSSLCAPADAVADAAALCSAAAVAVELSAYTDAVAVGVAAADAAAYRSQVWFFRLGPAECARYYNHIFLRKSRCCCLVSGSTTSQCL